VLLEAVWDRLPRIDATASSERLAGGGPGTVVEEDVVVVASVVGGGSSAAVGAWAPGVAVVAGAPVSEAVVAGAPVFVVDGIVVDGIVVVDVVVVVDVAVEVVVGAAVVDAEVCATAGANGATTRTEAATAPSQMRIPPALRRPSMRATVASWARCSRAPVALSGRGGVG
jgi:hypothetical protein